MPNLAGLHDIEATQIALPDTWIVDTIAISESPPSKNYPSNLNVITRINWAYGSGGTLPLPSVYEAFAGLVAQYVNGCSGCKRWIIGNECNLKREWPDNTAIYPWHYAACYKLCRQAIHALPGHEQDEVLIAGSGPWNDELKYSDNPTGDWITYFEDTIRLCGQVSGFSIHSYCHGYDPALVTSNARMNPPFQDHFYNFRTYQDYCNAIPDNLRHLPVYLTEANGDGPWQSTSLMPAMLTEIDGWNKSRKAKVHCVVFYRYPRYDQFYIEGRDDVINEYRTAVSLGYRSPITPSSPTPVPPEPGPEPEPPTPAPGPGLEWDKRLSVRGCTLQPALVLGREQVERVRVGRWFDKDEAQGRVNIYVRLLDAQGKLAIGVPVTQFWNGGSDTKQTEGKRDPWLASKGLGAEYSLDFAMYNLAPAYGIRIDGGHAADIIDGCGLGSIEQPDYAIHVAYFFEWQLTTEDVRPPEPEPEPPIPIRDRLIWPVVGPVTQFFGSHGITYAGAPGHDGIDFAVVTGTPVKAVADGIVKWVGNDRDGFGEYVRIFHPGYGFHSFYAHLSDIDVQVGQPVKRGDTIGASGSTGNSTGPHLHFSTRIGEEDDYYELHDGYSNGAANPLAVYGLINRVDPNSTLMTRG